MDINSYILGQSGQKNTFIDDSNSSKAEANKEAAQSLAKTLVQNGGDGKDYVDSINHYVGELNDILNNKSLSPQAIKKQTNVIFNKLHSVFHDLSSFLLSNQHVTQTQLDPMIKALALHLGVTKAYQKEQEVLHVPSSSLITVQNQGVSLSSTGENSVVAQAANYVKAADTALHNWIKANASKSAHELNTALYGANGELAKVTATLNGQLGTLGGQNSGKNWTILNKLKPSPTQAVSDYAQRIDKMVIQPKYSGKEGNIPPVPSNPLNPSSGPSPAPTPTPPTPPMPAAKFKALCEEKLHGVEQEFLTWAKANAAKNKESMAWAHFGVLSNKLSNELRALQSKYHESPWSLGLFNAFTENATPIVNEYFPDTHGGGGGASVNGIVNLVTQMHDQLEQITLVSYPGRIKQMQTQLQAYEAALAKNPNNAQLKTLVGAAKKNFLQVQSSYAALQKSPNIAKAQQILSNAEKLEAQAEQNKKNTKLLEKLRTEIQGDSDQLQSLIQGIAGSSSFKTLAQNTQALQTSFAQAELLLNPPASTPSFSSLSQPISTAKDLNINGTTIQSVTLPTGQTVYLPYGGDGGTQVSTSEAMGYSLRNAVMNGDTASFQKLLNTYFYYCNKVASPSSAKFGLMPWAINIFTKGSAVAGTITSNGNSSATDADQDIIHALMQAMHSSKFSSLQAKDPVTGKTMSLKDLVTKAIKSFANKDCSSVQNGFSWGSDDKSGNALLVDYLDPSTISEMIAFAKNNGMESEAVKMQTAANTVMNIAIGFLNQYGMLPLGGGDNTVVIPRTMMRLGQFITMPGVNKNSEMYKNAVTILKQLTSEGLKKGGVIDIQHGAGYSGVPSSENYTVLINGFIGNAQASAPLYLAVLALKKVGALPKDVTPTMMKQIQSDYFNDMDHQFANIKNWKKNGVEYMQSGNYFGLQLGTIVSGIIKARDLGPIFGPGNQPKPSPTPKPGPKPKPGPTPSPTPKPASKKVVEQKVSKAVQTAEETLHAWAVANQGKSASELQSALNTEMAKVRSTLQKNLNSIGDWPVINSMNPSAQLTNYQNLIQKELIDPKYSGKPGVVPPVPNPIK